MYNTFAAHTDRTFIVMTYHGSSNLSRLQGLQMDRSPLQPNAVTLTLFFWSFMYEKIFLE